MKIQNTTTASFVFGILGEISTMIDFHYIYKLLIKNVCSGGMFYRGEKENIVISFIELMQNIVMLSHYLSWNSNVYDMLEWEIACWHINVNVNST